MVKDTKTEKRRARRESLINDLIALMRKVMSENIKAQGLTKAFEAAHRAAKARVEFKSKSNPQCKTLYKSAIMAAYKKMTEDLNV